MKCRCGEPMLASGTAHFCPDCDRLVVSWDVGCLDGRYAFSLDAPAPAPTPEELSSKDDPKPLEVKPPRRVESRTMKPSKAPAKTCLCGKPCQRAYCSRTCRDEGIRRYRRKWNAQRRAEIAEIRKTIAARRQRWAA